MNTRFCLLASLLLPSVLCTSVLTGCGGSSKTEEIYLPVGTARNVTVNLENGRSFVIGFNVISAQNAYIYSGESGSPSSASMHVRGTFPRTIPQAKYPFTGIPTGMAQKLSPATWS